MTDRRQLQSKWVPYVDKRIPVGAHRFLPRGPYDALTAARVDDFVRVTATDRDIRLQVLAVLRMHSSNGAEVVLGLAAILLAGLAIVVSVFVAITRLGHDDRRGLRGNRAGRLRGAHPPGDGCSREKDDRAGLAWRL